jgi:uncharacterized protein (DUF4415 family)
MKTHPTQAQFKEGRGYTIEDWEATDNPPLSDDELSKMRPIKQAMPWLYEAAVKAKEEKRLRGQRGLQKTPVKIGVFIRLDADIVEKFKATGAGWQSRMNAALREINPV